MAAGPATVMYLHSSSGRYGADRQLCLIASGLDPSRFRPLVVLPDRGPLADDLEASGIEVLIHQMPILRREHLSPGGLARLAWRTTPSVAWLARVVTRRRVAVIHSNTSVVLSGAPAAAVTGRPHVWHVREIYSRFSGWWPAYRRVLLSAKALPCVSQATAAQFGHPTHQRVRVIPDGLALEPRRALRAPARQALGLAGDAPAIAVLGRVSDWKGQDVLVRALAEPELRERGVLGLIAGDAWPGAEDRVARVLELASKLGVSDRLHMIGFRDDLANVLGAADLVAVPSTAPDPLPGSALEAAAAGCAVLAAAHGGLPEIIRDGETGGLVTPGDAPALSRAAAQLIDDPGRRERLGAAAAEDVRRRFSAERLLAAVQGLYDHVLARGRS
jgi:glycosyltransferase involved in cell wall biosynthesis